MIDFQLPCVLCIFGQRMGEAEEVAFAVELEVQAVFNGSYQLCTTDITYILQ